VETIELLKWSSFTVLVDLNVCVGEGLLKSSFSGSTKGYSFVTDVLSPVSCSVVRLGAARNEVQRC
jgi:hypothetical protein